MKFFRNFLFSEVDPLIKTARKRPLESSDMLPLPSLVDPRNHFFDESKLIWETPNLFLWSILRMTQSEIIPAYIMYFMHIALSLATPMLVHRFLDLLSRGATSKSMPEIIFVGFLLGAFGFLSGSFLQHYFFKSLRVYQITVNLINEKIFKHSLKLSMAIRQKNLIGDVVNHMSTDSESIADFSFVFADISSNLLLMLGVVAMLFYYLGSTTFFVLVIISTMIPLTKSIAKKFTKYDEEMMALRDKRVNLMTQVLNAIRVVKFYAWEKSVEDEVMQVREMELNSRKKLAKSEVLSGLLYMATSTFVLFMALAIHAYRGNRLDPALIFTCVALFGLLDGPIGEMSHHISRLTNAIIGAKRLISFLNQEIHEHKITTENDSISIGLNLKNVEVKYDLNSKSILSNIDFSLIAGQSLAIVGPVGSGKTTLLYTILEELNLSSGEIQFTDNSNKLIDSRPKIAFVPQEAFIINSSLKENILFGESVNDETINKAIFLSSLEADIKNFADGIDTEIGEKGVNLSGGQKQRVGLARAFISRPQLILLDDPLSAVDTHTEIELCDNLIFGEWKNISRVVVTHRLSTLTQFDNILFLKDGKISALGKFNEILKSCEDFKSFYAEHSKSHFEFEEQVQKTIDSGVINNVNLDNRARSGRITADEDREVGAVKKDVYLDYIKSLGGNNNKTRNWILVLLGLGSIVSALAPLLQKYWLSYYSTHQDQWSAMSGISIYGLLGIIVLLVSVMNSFFWLSRGIKSGQFLHDQMLKSVLRAPIRFFDSTPVGRILQRFSRDVESVDIYLQWSFVSVVSCILQVAVSLFLIISLMPKLIVIILPVLCIYYFIQNDYRKAAREAKRFDSVARSPRYAHFKETFQGLTIIRSYSKENWFIENFYQRLSESQRMFYSHYMLNRWFSSRIPLIGGIISISSTIGIAYSVHLGLMSAGLAGLVTLYSLSFWGYLNWGIRVFADIESRMTSVERLKFFGNLESEKNTLTKSEFQLDDNWPKYGEIRIEDIKVRYADHLPLVLKGITCKIQGLSKVGIMGRTGSGKSTFFQTLFRFIELTEGKILIDDVDISTVPLERLRRSLAIIPQDPSLFLGTIRKNLDRFDQYTDHRIEEVLRQTGLIEFVNSLHLGIHTEVNEGGNNFSQGQRQLFCMARALLTNAKIIVMDEATASVDVQTDGLIQNVIRNELKNVTLIIIAHRLGTIKDCDQIIELKDGVII